MLPLQRMALHRKTFQVGAEFRRDTIGRNSRARVVIPLESTDWLDMQSSAMIARTRLVVRTGPSWACKPWHSGRGIPDVEFGME
jgi:hypothetical protein